MSFRKILHVVATACVLIAAIWMHLEIQQWILLQSSWSALWYAVPILVLIAAALVTAPRAINSGTGFSKGLFGFILIWGGAAYFSEITLLLSGGCTSEVCIFVTAIQQLIAPFLLIAGAAGLLLTSWIIWKRQTDPAVMSATYSGRGFLITCCVAILFFYVLPAVGTVRSSVEPAFYVTPSSGSAPLAVNVTTNPAKDPGGSEFMDFGDGSTPEMAGGALDPNETHTFAYTYTKAGTYQITFYSLDSTGAKHEIAAQTVVVQ